MHVHTDTLTHTYALMTTLLPRRTLEIVCHRSHRLSARRMTSKSEEPRARLCLKRRFTILCVRLVKQFVPPRAEREGKEGGEGVKGGGERRERKLTFINGRLGIENRVFPEVYRSGIWRKRQNSRVYPQPSTPQYAVDNITPSLMTEHTSCHNGEVSKYTNSSEIKCF